MRVVSRHRRRTRRGGEAGFPRDARGVAAVEFVLWLGVLVVPVLSTVDIGVYAFQKMQLEIAGQAAVQQAWTFCDSAAKLPATANCTGLVAKMTTAAQSTSLGTAVTMSAPVEGYYCVDGNRKLQLVATPPTAPPSTCSAYSGSQAAPGDYIQVTVSYSYAPVFTGISAATLLTTPITRTAWMRLN